MIALQKPSGGVRGLVVGDFLRRLVARSLAQHYASDFDAKCHPFQYALSTRAGTEAFIHTLQLTTELDPSQTILSVDGIGAYDHVSRASMLQGLRHTPHAQDALPFVRLFYSQPSTYLWVDDSGHVHRITQADGGEQGDPLMPALFSLGLDFALRAFQNELVAGERVAAFLDDIYVTAQPNRIRALFDCLAHHLHSRTGIQLHQGKTQVWNASGILPPGITSLTQSAAVWVGDHELPRRQQGLRVLGLPIGTDEYIQEELAKLHAKQQPLLEAIPTIPDLQTSWLSLLYCAAPRPHYALRGLRPDLTREFATTHDQNIQHCLAQLLQLPALPEQNAEKARLALHHGGLGLRSALHHTAAAFWASWQDAANTIHNKTPELFQQVARHLQAPPPHLPTLQCLTHVQTVLNNIGFATPPWSDGTPHQAPAPPPEEPRDFLRGWQRAASTASDQAYCAAIRSALDPASQALLDSQSGPFAATVFTMLPTTPDLVLEPAHLRVLLLRRLRLPLPHTPARCRCQRSLDHLGDHRAACPRSGALRTRGVALERAMARICCEAGASVCTNVLLNDLNTQSTRTDERRIEVIANGLPLWNGAQLAIDTTLVSPLTSQAQPRRHQRTTSGAALRIARRAKERTYPEIVGGGRARLVVVALETAGKWSQEAATLLRLMARNNTQSFPVLLRQAARHAWISRWAAHMSAAAMRSFACSLLHLPASTTNNIDGPEPFLGDILTLHPHSHPPTSVLPPTPALNAMWILHIWTGQYKNSQPSQHIWRLASIKTVLQRETSRGKKEWRKKSVGR